jgi:hypothetical protein
MSEEVTLLRAEVVTLKEKELASNEVIDRLQSSIQDLWEMFLLEIAVDDPVPERASKGTRECEKMSSKKNKTSTTQKGDFLSLHKSRKLPAASDESSDEGEISSDEDDLPRSDLIGAAVPRLTEQVTRRPEFKTFVSYRSYRLADTSQNANAVVSGKINVQLKRLRHYADYKFSGDPAIQVLDFMRSFQEAADLNEVSEAAAAVLLPYFLEDRAKYGLSSCMNHIPACMPKFPAAVLWLLQSFAT